MLRLYYVVGVTVFRQFEMFTQSFPAFSKLYVNFFLSQYFVQYFCCKSTNKGMIELSIEIDVCAQCLTIDEIYTVKKKKSSLLFYGKHL